ncbi:hypothetical protein KP509_39G000500 [Ceratopteris richardii]|uniref:Glutathione reductase n=1 Tax=Ceratopteris richardii TaxID=49495 RepID=A0A8T2PXQ2_CERRI|nr:hypothetical protein KP509_39G000500 [Ceratopteris richardii]KAH7276274.1 hypothetical protein KP509_39G000500 [Ceratopteris richardii]
MARKMLVDGEDGTEIAYDYDLFTIGAGSGGVRASRMSASHGAKVAICELPFHPISSDKLGGCGGTCVIRGCVPKKILVYGASFRGEFEDSKNFGWDVHGDITFDWKRLIENKTKEITRLNGVYKRILSGAGVTLYEGAGKIIDPHTVEVELTTGETNRFTARHILIATGSRAAKLNIPGKELAITSDNALSLEEFPRRSVIVGGGYIAVEFAGIYNGMGSKVDLFYRKEAPLRGFDDEMRDVVAKNLEGRAINLHPKTNIVKIERVEGGLKAYTDKGQEIETDVVLMAVGRKPNTNGLNLSAVGVELLKDGAVKVNEYSQTNIPSIWAVGDVTNRINLTPVALMEGTCLAKTLFGGQKMKPDYENVPCAVFCIPPLSVVGMSEQEAIAKAKNDILVFTSSFTPMKNTVSGRQEKTIMKLIVDAETQVVLGAAMCGPDAPEIMQGIAVALKCNATKAQLDATVGIHPSAAEEFVTMRTATRRVSPDGQLKSI